MNSLDSENEYQFIVKCDGLSTGERAALKRNCGKLLNSAGSDAFTVFYRILPHGVPAYLEDRWFCAACLRCMWRPDEVPGLPIEKAMCQKRIQSEETGGLTKRIEALLDTEWDSDGFMCQKLWRMVKLLKSDGYDIDTAALLCDLEGWNSENRYIQKKWARQYYTSSGLQENAE